MYIRRLFIPRIVTSTLNVKVDWMSPAYQRASGPLGLRGLEFEKTTATRDRSGSCVGPVRRTTALRPDLHLRARANFTCRFSYVGNRLEFQYTVEHERYVGKAEFQLMLSNPFQDSSSIYGMWHTFETI